ncbi:MAG: hypothetical protein IKF71_01445 [Bacilli bacterium]|nr:hypothetical protein [Bacilli bacterium]
MYIDLIILIIGIIVVIMFFKRFSSFVFFVAIVDIFLRILTFIKNNIGLRDVAAVIGKYLPESVIAIIERYTYSMPLLCSILKWCFVLIMAIFLVYITKIFIHKKKI